MLKICIKYTCVVVLIALSIGLRAQNIDSLKAELKKAKHDTTRCNILTAMIEAESDDAIWPSYNDELFKIVKSNLKATNLNKSEFKFYQKNLASFLNNTGYLAEKKGDISKALDYYGRGLKIQEEIGDKSGIAVSLNNIGLIYANQGDDSKAIKIIEEEDGTHTPKYLRGNLYGTNNKVLEIASDAQEKLISEFEEMTAELRKKVLARGEMKFRIGTTCSIRGTEYHVSIDSIGNSQIYVMNGMVDVIDDVNSKYVTLTPGYMCTVNTEGEITGLFLYKMEEKDKWWLKE